MPRTDPPQVAGERDSLEGWLDYHRSTLLAKCQGLTGEQLARRAVPPSSLSLLGLVRHMADVERAWFRRRVRGRDRAGLPVRQRRVPGRRIRPGRSRRRRGRLGGVTRECELARAAAAGRSLDETFVHERDGSTYDLRWVYLHMIEEYARHNGHADLLREQIDGVTGD